MRFRCNVCVQEGKRFPHMLEFESDRPVCPQCGAAGPPLIAALIDVHFVILSAKGAINAGSGRQYIACEPRRTHFGIDPRRPYSATGEVTAVTCPRCKGTKEYREAAMAVEELREQMEREAAKKIIVADMGG